MERHHTIYMKPSSPGDLTNWSESWRNDNEGLSTFHLAMAQLQLACGAERPRRSWCVNSGWSQGNQISSSLCRKLFQQLSTPRLWSLDGLLLRYKYPNCMSVLSCRIRKTWQQLPPRTVASCLRWSSGKKRRVAARWLDVMLPTIYLVSNKPFTTWHC